MIKRLIVLFALLVGFTGPAQAASSDQGQLLQFEHVSALGWAR